MDWRSLIVGSVGELERLLRDDRSARMAAMAGLLALMAVAAAALLLGRVRRRRVTAVGLGTGGAAGLRPGSDHESLGDWGMLDDAPSRPERSQTVAGWPIDRALPRGLRGTLGLALAAAAALWLAGLALAPDVRAFLASREWQFQPVYFAAHIVALRLFILVYARGFARGAGYLDIAEPELRTLVNRILGLPGLVMALVIALPFAGFDFLYLFSSGYERLGGPDQVAAVDYLMWVIWSVEWFFNAFIWVVLLGFLMKNCWVIRRHPFRAPIEIVLHDRHYRPFLQMSAQGATIVLAFTIVTVVYIGYTGGELTDYVGLAITAALLVVGFIPPWALLKSKVERAVEEETLAMRHRLMRNLEQAELAAADAAGGAGATASVHRTLEHRLDAAVAILRISYLENRNRNLGLSEARAVLIRMAAPAASIGWQLSKTHGDVIKDLPAYFSRLLN